MTDDDAFELTRDSMQGLNWHDKHEGKFDNGDAEFNRKRKEEEESTSGQDRGTK